MLNKKRKSIYIAIYNRKGGVGKTGLALLLMQELTRCNYTVLMVDCDSQHNASNYFDVTRPNDDDDDDESTDIYDPETGEEIQGAKTSADMIIDNVPAAECVIHAPNGDIIPSEMVLAKAEGAIEYTDNEKSKHDRAERLRKSLQSIDGLYDFVFLDCNTQLDVVIDNVLVASDFIIVPFDCQDALDVIKEMYLYFKHVKTYYGEDKYRNFELDFEVLGYVHNKYSRRSSLCKALDEQATQKAEKRGTRLLKSKVRKTADCETTLAAHLPIAEYDKKNKTLLDVEELTTEIIGLIKKTPKGQDITVRRKRK